MKLHEFLKINNVNKLAAKIGTSPMYLRQIGWKKAMPSLKMAQKIVAATNGEVTYEDLVADMLDLHAARRKKNHSGQAGQQETVPPGT